MKLTNGVHPADDDEVVLVDEFRCDSENTSPWTTLNRSTDDLSRSSSRRKKFKSPNGGLNKQKKKSQEEEEATVTAEQSAVYAETATEVPVFWQSLSSSPRSPSATPSEENAIMETPLKTTPRGSIVKQNAQLFDDRIANSLKTR